MQEAPDWKDLQLVWTPPDYPEYGLYHITHPDDLVSWAHYMGHSGARYQKWAIDTPIWAFLTFLDEERHPHCTIHLKEERWLYTDHPDDADALSLKVPWPLGDPSARDANGKAKYWFSSTLYDRVDKRYRKPINFKGARMVVMSAGHRDGDPLWTGEEMLMNQWYATVRGKNAK